MRGCDIDHVKGDASILRCDRMLLVWFSVCGWRFAPPVLYVTYLSFHPWCDIIRMNSGRRKSLRAV